MGEQMALVDLLKALESSGIENDAIQSDKSKKYLNITKETGEFLAVLVKATKARRILEIGTSNGYSTLWLASALPAKGIVKTVEVSEEKSREALENFAKAKLSDKIELLHGNALEILHGLQDAFDLIFLDADRSAYFAMKSDVLRLLKPGGILVCDNAVSHANELAGFMASFNTASGFSTCLVPVGKGEFVVYKS